MERIYILMKQIKSLDINDDFDDSQDGLFNKVIQNVMLHWHSFDFKKKCALFSDHACHELNFFLFKKDIAFFQKVVKVLI